MEKIDDNLKNGFNNFIKDKLHKHGNNNDSRIILLNLPDHKDVNIKGKHFTELCNIIKRRMNKVRQISLPYANRETLFL